MTCFAVDSRTLAIRSALPLPAENTTRWSVDRKLRLVAAWHYGQASIADMRERWRVETEEFIDWLLAFDTGGARSLCNTKPKSRSLVWRNLDEPTEGERRVLQMLRRYEECRDYATVAREFGVAFATAQHDISRARMDLRRRRRRNNIRARSEGVA